MKTALPVEPVALGTGSPSEGKVTASVVGALAGAATTVGFAGLHQLLISDIWFSLPAMLVAGAICGACLAWSHAVLFIPGSARSWLAYNLVHVALFLSLGALSFLVYEPVTTITELLIAEGPPSELVNAAFPLTLAFTFGATAVLWLLWARTAAQLAAAFVTVSLLVVLFGLNVSVIGLVEMSGVGYRAAGLFFALVVIVLLGNAAIHLALGRALAFAMEGSNGGGAA